MAEYRDYIVTQDEAGIRLDRFVADKEDGLSRSFIHKLILDGYITVSDSMVGVEVLPLTEPLNFLSGAGVSGRSLRQVKPSYNVRAGDVVRVRLPEPKSHTGPQAENIPLDILFEDDDFIVLNKPAGMVVHPAAGVDSGTLVNAILGLRSLGADAPGSDNALPRGKEERASPLNTPTSLAHITPSPSTGEELALNEVKGRDGGDLSQSLSGRDTADQNDYDDESTDDSNQQKLSLNSISPGRPGIVHRLDKDTSGIIVVAKTVKAYYNLAEQFREHSVNRKYVALVCGDPKQDSGIIVAPIGRSRRDRKKMAVTPVHSREAMTQFSVIERYGGFSLLDVTPKTGRTHQIRVHLSHIGHPVVGDPTYGGRDKALKLAVSYQLSARSALQRLSRQALHAQLLGFIHPSTGKYMEFTAPIPRDIQDVIDALKRE